MTALDDAVAVLRDQRLCLDQKFAAAIESLLSLNSSLSVLGGAFAQPAEVAHRTTTRAGATTPAPTLSTTAGAAPTCRKPAPARATRPLPEGSLLDRVYRTVRSAGPDSAVHIGELTGLSRSAASSALKALRLRGLVTLDGQSHKAQWAIVARRPEVDHRPADPVVVWSGTKERTGEAPGLSRVTGRLS